MKWHIESPTHVVPLAQQYGGSDDDNDNDVVLLPQRMWSGDRALTALSYIP